MACLAAVLLLAAAALASSEAATTQALFNVASVRAEDWTLGTTHSEFMYTWARVGFIS